MTLYKQLYSSPLGDLSLVADEHGLCGIWFLGQKYFEKGLTSQPLLESTDILEQTKACLDAYFKGQEVLSLPALSLSGTPFQKRVWQELQTIAFGQTVTYGELAKKLSCGSAQAVGSAIGKNPVSILIPCHRVLASDGCLTGYAGGLDKKAWLLAHEKRRKDADIL